MRLLWFLFYFILLLVRHDALSGKGEAKDGGCLQESNIPLAFFLSIAAPSDFYMWHLNTVKVSPPPFPNTSN